ncbi:3-hydroxyacyl-ACP dehydratase FabZ family protein [Lacipirellula sp.]|uniref:3-hydroxyacyl-ACP dehydratase FabZ family protein n=1 Tax=Lacipirellula sp. TaxID=2691419 RepID=UPI003D1112E0
MPAQELIVDPAEIDFSRIVADLDEIRQYIPQRFAMEQLTAIVLDDVERKICVGYRDLTDQEFWVSGHMPAYPLLPGVIMCEAAAQVLSFHVQKNDLSGVEVVGFGGLDKVKFRGVVRPGDRLMVAIQVTKFRRGRMVVCKFQEFVGTTLVCEGELTGIALPPDIFDYSPAAK